MGGVSAGANVEDGLGSNGLEWQEESAEGTCKVDRVGVSSLSELCRLIGGASAFNARPTALALLDIFFVCNGPKPASMSLELARSLSERSLSLSAAMDAHWARCFSITFQSWEFCAC